MYLSYPMAPSLLTPVLNRWDYSLAMSYHHFNPVLDFSQIGTVSSPDLEVVPLAHPCLHRPCHLVTRSYQTDCCQEMAAKVAFPYPIAANHLHQDHLGLKMLLRWYRPRRYAYLNPVAQANDCYLVTVKVLVCVITTITSPKPLRSCS